MQSPYNAFESVNGILCRVTLLCFLPAGNYLRRVSCSTWHHCVSCRQETFSPGDFSTPLPTLEMTGGMAAMGFSTTVSSQQTAVSGQSGPTKKRGPMAPLFVIPYFSDV